MPEPSFGCEILAEGNPALVDIVFVHGLNGDRRDSWTKVIKHGQDLSGATKFFKGGRVKECICWPKDLLPQDLPTARVIAYGHCGEVARLFKPSPKYTLYQIGQDLVTRLQGLRDAKNEQNRPLIFVAHSLGGLVVKDALQYSQDQYKVQQRLYSIYSAAYGVVFFGTPHRGSRIVPLANLVANLVNRLHDVNTNLLTSMKEGSETLDRLNESFSRMLHPYGKGLKIHSFKEALPMSAFAFVGKAVADESAIMGYATEGKSYINGNHTEMCRFGDRSDPDYRLVLGILRGFTEELTLGDKPTVETDVNDECTSSKLEDLTSRILSHTNGVVEGAKNGMGIEYGATISRDTIKRQKKTDTIPSNLGFLPNTYFTGRERELQDIHRLLHRLPSRGQNILILHGLGGVGKTQIAIEYSRRYASRFSDVLWIDGRSYSTALLSYHRIVKRIPSVMMDGQANGNYVFHHESLLGLRESDAGHPHDSITYLESCCEAVKNWLARSTNTDWLFILDNLDDLESYDLLSVLPASQHGRIIITSRRRQAIRLGTPLEIKTMDEEDAVDLLLKSSDRTRQDKKEEMDSVRLISHDLGHLPLALDQAGAFIAKTRISFKEYRRSINTESRQSLTQKPARILWTYQDTVFTTWNRSLDQIQKESDLSWRLLVLCSCLALEGVSFDLLRICSAKTWDGEYEFSPLPQVSRGAGSRSLVLKQARVLKRSLFYHQARCELRNPRSEHVGPENTLTHIPISLEWLRQLTSNEVRFRAALGILFDYSMVKESADQNRLSLHPLVHWWCRERLPTAERSLKTVEAMLLVSLAAQYSNERTQDINLHTGLDIHIESCIQLLEHLESSPTLESEYSLCESMIWLSSVLNDQAKSKKLVGESIRRIEKYPKPLKALKHSAVHAHAKNLETEGLRDEAEKMYKDLLEQETAEFGEADPRTLSTLQSLATICARDGKAMEAKTMMRKVLHHREEQEGKFSSSRLCTLNNLAFVYLQQGQFPAARDLLMTAMEVVKKAPKLTPLSLAIHVNAAHMYEQCGESETASGCLETAVAEAMKAFGRYHPLTIGTAESCTELAERRGMLSKAIESELNVLEAKILTIGDSHSATAGTVRNLARLYWQHGNTTEAEFRFGQLLLIQKDTYGDDDPNVLETINSLGLIDWDCGRLEDAIDKFRKVFEAQAIGPSKDSSLALMTGNNLGVALKDAGKFIESAEILESCAERAKVSCGSDSAEYLVLLDSLGRLCQAQGRLDASRSLFQQSLSGKKSILGLSHPLTLSTMHNLAVLCFEQGNIIEAQKLFREALSGKMPTLGPESPYTLKTAHYLRVSGEGLRDPKRGAKQSAPAIADEDAGVARIGEGGSATMGVK